MIIDWDSAAHAAITPGFGPANQITVLFDDRTLSFPMSAAATLADLAERLAAAGGPQRRPIRAVTVKLGHTIGLRKMT